MRVGIVADDLTGAMDSAAPFADRGFRTRVLVGLPATHDESADSACAVLAINTHSRDLPPSQAARAVQLAVEHLDQDRLPFKKIDSTLRGNIGVEIAAAMRASARACAIVAPAAPKQGRELRGGQLFVHGTCTNTKRLQDTLAADLRGVAVRTAPSCTSDTTLFTAGVYVADAEDDDELACIARCGLSVAGDTLLVGSSGLACALAANLAPPPWRQGVAPRYERLLFVVGSFHASSAEQVRALAARPEVTRVVLSATGELRVEAAGAPGASVGLLHVAGIGEAPTLDPAWVAHSLAHATATLLACEAAPTALFLTGGDTATAVLSRLGVGAIDVLGNHFPGVVHGQVRTDSQTLGIITKSGGFGSADLFVRAVAELVGPTTSL